MDSKCKITKKFGKINLRKLNELGVRKPYQTEIRKNICSFKNLSDDESINRAWENIK